MLPEETDIHEGAGGATGSLATAAPGRSPVVIARDASYRAAGYRSFEYASFEVRAGDVFALVSTGVAAARDLALACAGIIRPTSGSLVVDGVELAHRSGRLRRTSLRRGFAGVGVFSGLFDVDAALTTEQAIRRELTVRRDRSADALEYLSGFGLATHAGRFVSDLEPAARVRLSLALACAGDVRLAAIDLSDRFCDGAPMEDIRRALILLGRACAARGVCALVATGEPALADAFSGVCPLDVAAAERLGDRALGGLRPPSDLPIAGAGRENVA